MNETLSHPMDGQRWGFWATLGFSLIVIFAFVFLQSVLAVIFSVWESQVNPGLDTETYMQSLINDGNYLAWATVLSAFWCTGLVVIFSSMRNGVTLVQYINLKPISIRQASLWILVLVGFLLGWEGLHWLLEKPFVTEDMIQSYTSAETKWVFWVALVIGAPVVEEFLFRGFLFEGLRDTRLGPVGAVVITSVIWASIHQQYEMFEIIVIGTMGVVLGIAKIKTGSLYTTIIMHSMNNFVATLQVALLLSNQ